MDHHCPWIGNTVGHANHKSFLLFLLYTNTACGMLNFALLDLLMHATLPALSKFLIVGSVGLSSLLSSILGPFFGFHCFLLSRNMTTIEFVERSRDVNAEKHAQPPGILSTASPYDVGMYGNICSILGENPLLWLIPVGDPVGDGISFPRSLAASPSSGCSRAAPMAPDHEILLAVEAPVDHDGEDEPSAVWTAASSLTGDCIRMDCANRNRNGTGAGRWGILCIERISTKKKNRKTSARRGQA